MARVDNFIRTAPVGPESAKAAIGQKWIVSTVLPRLRTALYAAPPMVDQFVGLFADEAIRAEKRANFTFHEFYLAYEQLL